MSRLLPDTITYNRATTPDGYTEFSWGVTFDINGDGAINQGDVELKILHYKAPGSIETTGPISDLDANLWLHISDSSLQTVAAASKLISGNSITISIDKSAHPSLSNISDTTLVYFSTSNVDSEFDYYPAPSTLGSIPANRQFTDPQGDVSGPEIDMVNMTLSY